MTTTPTPTPAPTIERLCRFAELVAAERTNDPHLYADAAQEGRIAAWRSLTDHPDKPQAYHLASVRRAAVDVLRGRPATGAPSMRGRTRARETPLLVHGTDGTEALVAEPVIPYFAETLVDGLVASEAVERAMEALRAMRKALA